MSPSRAVVLYRSLLKAHKKHLPREMRQLGDSYVKSEFKLHKNAKPEHLDGFFSEWEKYLAYSKNEREPRNRSDNGPKCRQFIERRISVWKRSQYLPKDIELDDEKRKRLQSLRKEAEKFGKSEK